MKIASDMPRIWLQPAEERLNFLESVGTTLRLCLVSEGMWLTPWCVVSIWLADWLGSDNTAANNAMVRDFEFKHDTAPDIRNVDSAFPWPALGENTSLFVVGAALALCHRGSCPARWCDGRLATVLVCERAPRRRSLEE